MEIVIGNARPEHDARLLIGVGFEPDKEVMAARNVMRFDADARVYGHIERIPGEQCRMNGRQSDRSEATRAEALEALERALADERERSAELRKTVSELRFRIEIQEKSYSKQLDDARASVESAERRAEELGMRVAELDAARQDSIELLAETQAEIDRLTAERDQYRRELASRDGLDPEHGGEVDYSDDGGTINALMDDVSWSRKAKAAAPDAAPEDAGNDEESGADMLAPELVLTGSDGDD